MYRYVMVSLELVIPYRIKSYEIKEKPMILSGML